MTTIPIGVLRASKAAQQIAEPTSEIVERLLQAFERGEFSEKEQQAYAVWMTRHDGESGTPNFELMGGETGVRWLDGMMEAKAASLQAEPEEVLDPTREDIIAGAVEYLNLKDHATFMRIWTVLEMAAKNALRRSVAKAKGTIRNEDLKVKMAAADRPLNEIPDNVWQSAKLDTSTRHILESSIAEAIEEVRGIFLEDSTLLPRMAEIVQSPVTPELLQSQEEAIEEAIRCLDGELLDSFESWVRPRDAEPDWIVAPGIVRRAMLIAGGADSNGPTINGFPCRRGRGVASGFGMLNGPLAFEMLRSPSTKAAAVEIPENLAPLLYRWRHGYLRQPKYPFAPHQKLNGRTFKLGNWEKLLSRRKDINEWPYVDPADEDLDLDLYRPGDHDGCTCAVLPVVTGRGRIKLGAEWFDAQLAGRSPEARAALFNPRQPRCPKGTGITAGRFSNEQLTNCNPMVEQLHTESLRGRIDELEAELGDSPSREKREKLVEELKLAQLELERRLQGGEPEGPGVTDDVTQVTEAEPDYGVPIDELAELVDETGGFTVRSEVDTPGSGFVVADPEFATVISDWDSLTDQEKDSVIIEYLLRNEQALIDNPEVFVGAWRDSETGKLHLDMVNHFTDQAEAERLGSERNQIAVFDLGTFDEIPTGGTGNVAEEVTGAEFVSTTVGRIREPDGSSAEGGTGPAWRFDPEVAKKLVAEGWRYSDPFPDPIIEAQIQQSATAVRDGALREAAAVRGNLIDIAAATSGEVLGLQEDGTVEFEVKGIDSTARKMRDRHVERGKPLSELPGAIKDSLRYTYIHDDNNYTGGVQRTFDTLQQRGWEVVEVDNYWSPGDAYSGINSILRTSEGRMVELQFHTPISFSIKEDIHLEYELYRELPATDPQAWDLWESMSDRWDNVRGPTGWPPINLNTFGGLAHLRFDQGPNPNEFEREVQVGVGR